MPDAEPGKNRFKSGQPDHCSAVQPGFVAPAVPRAGAIQTSDGRVAAPLHWAERKAGTRSHDATIAAVALANDLPLFTGNPVDAAHIEGMDLRSVPHPERRSGI